MIEKTPRPSGIEPRTDAGKATAENGMVILDGPDGVAVTMTPAAARQTADSLYEAARQARAQLEADDDGQAGTTGDAGGST